MKQLSQQHFEAVLEKVRNQVFSGKGEQRHGHGTLLEDQPWVKITEHVGRGFLLGQALKKVYELRSFETNDPKFTDEQRHEAWVREAIGAIVYLTFAIMNKEAGTV